MRRGYVVWYRARFNRGWAIAARTDTRAQALAEKAKAQARFRAQGACVPFRVLRLGIEPPRRAM